jgi:hypothetical protein
MCEIPPSQLPQAVIKGDGYAIQIPEEEYMAGMDTCKLNLHGRVLWPKGSTPLTVVSLKAKLSNIWKNLSRWGIQSLGKGYFEFTFTNLEDVRRVRSVSSWNLSPGYLKLFAWSPDFSPKTQQNTNAQVWVRIYGLSQEYCRKNILFSIVSGVGSPICTDTVIAKPMIERTFGQYARVLVDIDLTQTLKYSLLVERKGFAFYVELEYENLPDFCAYCKITGHHVDYCKKWRPEFEDRHDKTKLVQRNNEKPTKLVFAQKSVGSQNQNKEKEAIDVDKEVVNLDEQQPEGQEISEEEIGREKTAEKGKALATNLSPEALLRLQDTELEKELNESVAKETQELNHEDDVSISHGSFVADTQKQDSPLEASENEDDQIEHTPVRVMNDMVFLQKSWAHMTEAEVEEINIPVAAVTSTIVHAPAIVDKEGFQMVLPKTRKKTQKNAIQISKGTYSTRAKVPQKPFK